MLWAHFQFYTWLVNIAEKHDLKKQNYGMFTIKINSAEFALNWYKAVWGRALMKINFGLKISLNEAYVGLFKAMNLWKWVLSMVHSLLGGREC